MANLSHFLVLFVSLTCYRTTVARVLHEPYDHNFVPDFTCCYGKRLLQHGEVALSLPECCLQLKCSFGLLKLEQVGHTGDTYCCEFDGQLYPPGYELDHCFPLVCKHGKWNYLDHIDDCCKHCAVFNDPHFYTFDDQSYDWHDDCNYTVTQNDLSYHPEVGVFSDFYRCWGCASCLGETTFRNDPHTILTLRNGAIYDVLVNGDTFTVPHSGVHVITSSASSHPVLAWRKNNCIVLLGSSRIVLQHCRNRLDVWAHPSHAESLDGLCGHYNFYVRDDFTDRQGNIHDLEHWPLEFPMSWKTNDQSNPHCRRHYNDQSYGCPKGNPCRAKKAELDGYLARCRKALNRIIARHEELLYLIDACAFDLCMMHQNGEALRTIEEWLRELQDNARIAKDIIIKTTGEKIDAPIKPVVHHKPVHHIPKFSKDLINPRQTLGFSNEPTVIDGFSTIVTYDSTDGTLTQSPATYVHNLHVGGGSLGLSKPDVSGHISATVTHESPAVTITLPRLTNVHTPVPTKTIPDIHVSRVVGSPSLTSSEDSRHYKVLPASIATFPKQKHDGGPEATTSMTVTPDEAVLVSPTPVMYDDIWSSEFTENEYDYYMPEDTAYPVMYTETDYTSVPLV